MIFSYFTWENRASESVSNLSKVRESNIKWRVVGFDLRLWTKRLVLAPNVISYVPRTHFRAFHPIVRVSVPSHSQGFQCLHTLQSLLLRRNTRKYTDLFVLAWVVSRVVFKTKMFNVSSWFVKWSREAQGRTNANKLSLMNRFCCRQWELRPTRDPEGPVGHFSGDRRLSLVLWLSSSQDESQSLLWRD